MNKSIQLFTAIALLFATACDPLNMEDKNPRTPEMETAELNKALSLLEADGYDIDTTDLGIYYIEHVEGKGPLAREGDTLRLEYAGYLLDGRMFDASAFHYPDSVWEFIFTASELIPGFADGLLLMKKGAEIDLIIPSEYGYGAIGYGGIGPYTTLVFATKMHDINPRTDQ